jgi:two-component system, chemotaxis family, CheB/CheR fusion protein
MATKRKKQNHLKPHGIIGIGASAGGLEAINDFFQNTPVDTDFTFVLIQHLSPDHKSLMSELLSKHTQMKVYEAEDQMTIMPNCIYLLPNKKLMTIKSYKLQLQDKTKSLQPNNAIDVFFHSLAEEHGKDAIGIILSGTGTDGSLGLQSIKKNGGIAIVQDPLTAAFDGMPNSAIDAGVADMILAPENIMNELMEFINEPEESKAFHLDAYRDEVLMRDILMLIQRETGQDFNYYKRPTLFRRLSKRLMELNIPNVRDYLDYVNFHPEEITLLSQEFLINVTYFFRDQEAFDIIEDRVIPEIMKDKKPGDTVKLWSAACSSGEEAYSLAILFDEYFKRNNLKDITLKIFATDIDREALEMGSKGVYQKNYMTGLSPSRVDRYFIQEANHFKISPDLRRMIVFSYHDLLKDPPYSRMDMVVCRNVLIYINSNSQKEIIRKIHFSLNIGGFMFLGPSEYTGRLTGVLEEVDKKWRIYRTISKAKLSGKDSIYLSHERKFPNMDIASSKIKNPLNHIADLFKDTLLERHEFAGIFIDPNFEVKQTTGNYKNYIEFPETGLHFNLMKLVPSDLGIALNIAIRKAIKNNETVHMSKVNIKSVAGERRINLTVKPYLKHKDYQEPFLFIVLNEEIDKNKKETKENRTNNHDDIRKTEELEKELKETRENLQSVIEEIESANEELQSANEEMVSTNEELQSTNEELQSLNEELHTVSAEHQQKIKELMDMNDDMNNYFINSEIGQILIDNRMIIRRFSPAVTRMVNLIPSDINRSILDITTRFKHFDFIGDIRQVIIDNSAVEKEIIIGDYCYLLRITPYIRQDRTIDGAVVNFIDITEQKKLNSILEAVLNSSPSSIGALNALRNKDGQIEDFIFITANSSLEKEMGLEPGQVTGRPLSRFAKYNAQYFHEFSKVVSTSQAIHKEFQFSDRWYDVNISKLSDGLVIMSTDITEKKTAIELINRGYEELKETSEQLQAANDQLEQTNLDLMQFASVASHDLKEPLRKIQAFGNILMTKVKEKLEKDELNHLDKIVNSSNRMQKLIEDVLTLSKLSNRDQVFEIVDLNEVLNRIVDDLEITIKEKNAQIKVDQLPVIQGVSGQMHQVFQNLISNSIKFAGDINPDITVSEKRITPEQAKQLNINADDYVSISLKDTGIGFEKEYKDKIFGIFQRLHGNNFEGTGIGLAICRKIVDNHGGFILAESELGKGSEFFILLPKKRN